MHTPSHPTALSLMMSVMPRLRHVLVSVRVHDKNLELQARRAATSVLSNLAEADGVRGGHRRERIQTALGSLCELRAQLKLAVGWGFAPEGEVAGVDRVLDRVGAMSWRRLQRAR